jgi:excisionase family DNA binding protein
MANAIRWLTTRQAADRACCGTNTIRRAVRGGRLRSARVGRGELQFRECWIDEWLTNQLMPEDDAIDVAIDAMPSGPREPSWQ